MSTATETAFISVSDRFHIQRSIRLLDDFMSAGGWRSPKSAQNHLVTIWEKELVDEQAKVHEATPDGLLTTVRIDHAYLRWQAGIAWDVWFSIRSYGDALKWQEGGPLNGKIDPLTRVDTRYSQYRLDTRFPVEPTMPHGFPVPTAEELWERTRASRPRPLSGGKRLGRPKKVGYPVDLTASGHA